MCDTSDNVWYPMFEYMVSRQLRTATGLINIETYLSASNILTKSIRNMTKNKNRSQFIPKMSIFGIFDRGTLCLGGRIVSLHLSVATWLTNIKTWLRTWNILTSSFRNITNGWITFMQLLMTNMLIFCVFFWGAVSLGMRVTKVEHGHFAD